MEVGWPAESVMEAAVQWYIRWVFCRCYLAGGRVLADDGAAGIGKLLEI